MGKFALNSGYPMLSSNNFFSLITAKLSFLTALNVFFLLSVGERRSLLVTFLCCFGQFLQNCDGHFLLFPHVVSLVVS